MTDDIVAPFSLDAAPVRGRIARLGAGALDPIVRRHDYPWPAALLLGEALTLAALIGSLLKVDGRLVVQAQGAGPVPLLVAEHAAGALRGYARIGDRAAIADAGRMSPRALIGEGALAITLDRGEGAPIYQGVASLDGDTLAACAEHYFRASEQTDTRIHLAMGEVLSADAPPLWRAGGVLMQRIAGDAARGDTHEDWNRPSLLFATLSDEEVLDPALPSDRLLYRLFHEEGVRMGEPAALADRCTCNEARLTELMRQFPPAELRDLIEPDGFLHARCQFCSRLYLVAPDSVGA
jgi:molecular chaperone Hsp33